MTTDTTATGADTTQAGDQASTAAQAAGADGNSNGDASTLLAGQGQQQTEQKPADKQPGDEVKYDFKAPEGMELNPAQLEQFTALAKEMKLPAEQAQKVVDLAIKAEQARMEEHSKLVKGWADEVKADKEIGGDKLPENLAAAKKALDLGPPELKALLNDSGLGNHPAVVKWAIAVGKALSEDKFVPAGQAAPMKGDVASRLYPNTPSQ